MEFSVSDEFAELVALDFGCLGLSQSIVAEFRTAPVVGSDDGREIVLADAADVDVR